jgi:lipoprotein-releasing system ATP-binding protein
VTKPRIILADEPTGNLDPLTAQGVFDYFMKIVKEQKNTLIMATHNLELAQKMDRIFYLENGRIKEDKS